MRGICWTLLVCWVGTASGRAAEPSPREVIERGIKAHGGKEVMNLKAALHFRMEGKLHLPGGVPGPATMQVELYRSPGLGEKTVVHGNVVGTSFESIEVHRGDKSWRSVNGTVTGLSDEERKGNQEGAYLDRMNRLTHLLEDKAFTLKALPGGKVEGRPAHAIEVSHKGRPDVRLYFDKEAGFLVKVSYTPTVGSTRGKLQEVIFGDFRDPGDPAAAEKALKAAGTATDAKALLAYLRERTPAPGAEEKARKLVARLGADEFADREQAQKELIALGKAALPELKKAAASKDAEVARRAKECLKHIKGGDERENVRAAVRLLARKAAPGTARGLLDLLPGAEETVAEEIRSALAHLAKGKEAKALEAALDDKDPVKKAAAQATLGKDGGKYLARPGRRLYLAGFKYPMKHTYYQDGKKVLEGQIVQIDFYNALDEKVFAKPK
jgi:hypothetical protein